MELQDNFILIIMGLGTLSFVIAIFAVGIKSDKAFEETLQSRYEWPNPPIDDLDLGGMKTGYTSSYTFPWTITTTTQTLRKRVKKKFQRKPSYMKRKPRSEYQYIYYGDDY